MILFISNGYGEDLVACNLIKALRNIKPSEEIRVIPLVGEGIAYQQLGIQPEFLNKMFPSGGIIRTFKHLMADIKAGLFQHIFFQKKMVAQLSAQATITICVGDVFCLWMGYRVEQKQLFFLPTAKSDRFMSHSLIERFLIRIWAKKVFTRDTETAESLQKKRIDAIFLGNPMLDYLEFSSVDYEFNQDQPIIGILPGSREEAYQNLCFILKLVEEMYQTNPSFQYFFSKADSLSQLKLIASLHAIQWDFQKRDSFSVLIHREKGICVKMAQKFGDILSYSTCVIGLAGTANEQAVYAGKPVICFEGSGSQSSAQRFQEQKKLLGDLLIFVPKRDRTEICKMVFKYAVHHTSQDFLTHQNASEQIMGAILKMV